MEIFNCIATKLLVTCQKLTISKRTGTTEEDKRCLDAPDSQIRFVNKAPVRESKMSRFLLWVTDLLTYCDDPSRPDGVRCSIQKTIFAFRLKQRICTHFGTCHVHLFQIYGIDNPNFMNTPRTYLKAMKGPSGTYHSRDLPVMSITYRNLYK